MLSFQLQGPYSGLLRRAGLLANLILAQRFFEHEDAVFQRLELHLVVVLPMFLVKMLCNVTHHDHRNGEETTLGGAVTMQSMMQPRVDVRKLLRTQTQISACNPTHG